ncbi:helix-turn-helix domain-containing protein [Streptococcus mitis]|uniref:Rgg/GadR/MutR family transcriptional regulator n=1 Tax=Streptococcus mitis TaxID=28037 RepID=UPI0013245297|nr:helix-turn-helix domain-containing protein [Streptococcus mitis]MQQ41145.1 helix-turn-helix domain-containing protein [Streptococcus mitis]MQQ62229.1 helix-turn-helix domain-containing protein [Streptococcus mitis]
MKNYGEAFRYFRKLNGYSLEYAAADSISKSQLSRFERGENEISLSTFFKLLSNINVSIENFCNYLEHYKRSELDDFLVNLSPNFYSLNTKGLEEIKNEQQKLFEKSGEKTHKINTIMVQGLLNQIDCNYVVSREDLNLVYDYLFQKERWESYEITLIGNLYHLFEIDYIYRVGKEILERTHYYEKIGKNRNLVVSACLNFWFCCLENSHLIYADYFEMTLKKLLKDDTKVFEKSTFKFVEGYKIYLTESKESGIKQMNNVIKYFEFIESKSIALYFQKRLNELVD